jgi:uncharacterized repeat protein (TIGR01451 family)
MPLNRILALPVLIGGIISGAAIPALGTTAIPLPTVPTAAHPYFKVGPAELPSAPAAPAGPAGPAVSAVSAAPARPAALAIRVITGPAPYRAGAVNRYTVLVRNEGTTEATRVPVMLVLPPSSKAVRTFATGTAEYGGVVWTADIKPLQQLALRATAVARATSADIEKVAATACILKTATTRQTCAATLLRVVGIKSRR